MKKTTDSEVIEIQNSQLGILPIRKNSILLFEQGILGYESLRHFALVNIKDCEPFVWFVSIDEPEIALPILNYKHTYPQYKLKLSKEERVALKLKESDPFHLFFIITVDEQKHLVTANLKGPLVIHLEKRLGRQVVVHNDKYIVNYPLTPMR